MEYISVREAAEKWGFTVRWVQQCCKNGLIPGASRLANAWIIPKHAVKPTGAKQPPIQIGQLMPLMNTVYQAGECAHTIETIADPDTRALAWAEYDYFRGDTLQAAQRLGTMMSHPNRMLRLSANILYVYAVLAMGHHQEARMVFEQIRVLLDEFRQSDNEPLLQAVGACVQGVSGVLLHLPTVQSLQLAGELRMLPKGLKLYACHVLAQEHYLKGEFHEAVSVAELALALPDVVYPIPNIFLHLSAADSLMRLKRVQEAKTHFLAAWELARHDGLIEGFAEHEGLLQTLVEVCLKKEYPQEYERISGLSRRFRSGWSNLHEINVVQSGVHNLSTTEWTIATLACDGWSNKEIAEFLHLSAHTVKNYISVLYQKLHITSRRELEKYILK